MTRTVTLRPSSAGVHEVQRQLRVLYAPGVEPAAWGQVYTLPVGVTHIRREAEQSQAHDVVVSSDSGISRLHARIEISAIDGCVRIEDCGSRNGIIVNSVRTAVGASQLLNDGDIVRVGSTFLLVRYQSAASADAEVPELVGASRSMAAVRYQLARLAKDRATVLILGETGTGKEVVSSALHRMSARAGARVAVNCSAVPEGLAESQFFGHLAGAFTGAKGQEGFFRAAHRGTLFLDEVGELPLPLQPKLLRALEDRSVTAVGATTPTPCDVRLLAATNRDLMQAIHHGTFREDLYARLSDVVIELPPLRERKEDILQLLMGACTDSTRELSPELVELLLLYAWPRNVREVQKVATHLRLFGPDESLRRRLGGKSSFNEDADSARMLAVPGPSAQNPARPERPSELPTRQQLEALLRKHGGVIQRVADELSCSRRQVGRMLAQQRVRPEHFRTAGRLIRSS